MALLGNVAGLMCFVFILFSCVGLQLFSGATTVSCKTVDLAATNASLCNPCVPLGPVTALAQIITTGKAEEAELLLFATHEPTQIHACEAVTA